MRTLLLLWLALAGACARLRCRDGQPCPATPVSAQGWGGYGGGVPATVGNPFHGFPPPPQVLPASSAAVCQDGSPCPTGTSCPLPEVSLPSVPQFPPPSLCHLGGGGGAFPPPAALPPPLLSPQGVPCAGGRHCCPRGSRCSADGNSCITSLGMGGAARGWAWWGEDRGYGGPSPHSHSPQPLVLSLVPTDSPSVPMMPPAA